MCDMHLPVPPKPKPNSLSLFFSKEKVPHTKKSVLSLQHLFGGKFGEWLGEGVGTVIDSPFHPFFDGCC